MKPGAEQSFLYGNHVLKSGLGRITENTMQYQGVVVYSMADMPLVSLVTVILAARIHSITVQKVICSPPAGCVKQLCVIIPQGFGVAAKTTQECRRVDPMSIVVFHQADVGEFIRNEDTLT